MLTLAPVANSDFDEMVDLRIEALRESLERLGRFDPVRARERLASRFVPEYMLHMVLDSERIGFITLRPDCEQGSISVQLDHLYVRPAFQGRGIGAWALDWAKSRAVLKNCSITLSALKQSAANRFYLRHGFIQVGEGEFDLDYCWSGPNGVPT
ncbi:MAG: GNAT family N-acetyltransferase [Comamonadaceae bacterium]